MQTGGTYGTAYDAACHAHTNLCYANFSAYACFCKPTYAKPTLVHKPAYTIKEVKEVLYVAFAHKFGDVICREQAAKMLQSSGC